MAKADRTGNRIPRSAFKKRIPDLGRYFIYTDADETEEKYDLYIDDKKKVTVRFVIGAINKTLTHEEIQKVSEEILSNLENNNYSIVK